MQDITEILNTITIGCAIKYIVTITGILSVVIEKSKKLPFNPWSTLFNWLGYKVNEPVNIRLDKIEEQNKDTNDYINKMRNEYKESIKCIRGEYNTRIDKLERNLDEKEAKRLRSSIICFSDSCRIGTHHTKRHFENAFRDYDDYIGYCESHDFENHFIDEEMAYIREVYNECLRENKFL